MKYILPIFFVITVFVGGCSKSKDQLPTEITLEEEEQITSDSLFSIHGVRFNNPLELTSIVENAYKNDDNLRFFIGFKKGDPWIAIFNHSNELLKEHIEALPDSIKSNKDLNRVFFYNEIQTIDVLIIPCRISDGQSSNGLAGYYVYSYDIKSNNIKRMVYEYGNSFEINAFEHIYEWHDGSFIGTSHYNGLKHSIVDRNLENISTYVGGGEYLASKGSFYFPSFRDNNYYPISMTDYFEIGINQFDAILVKKSLFSSLITPEYPLLPYYSYEIEKTTLPIIEIPDNFVRLDSRSGTIDDLGDRWDVTIEGVMLLADDKNQTYYEKEVSGKIFIEKKTGKVVEQVTSH